MGWEWGGTKAQRLMLLSVLLSLALCLPTPRSFSSLSLPVFPPALYLWCALYSQLWACLWGWNGEPRHSLSLSLWNLLKCVGDTAIHPVSTVYVMGSCAQEGLREL